MNSRIKRRNYFGFEGIGNYCGVGENHSYGDYLNPRTNNKRNDYENAKRRKFKLHFHVGSKILRKKFADNKQKL